MTIAPQTAIVNVTTVCTSTEAAPHQPPSCRQPRALVARKGEVLPATSAAGLAP